jgi:hypothetical protein
VRLAAAAFRRGLAAYLPSPAASLALFAPAELVELFGGASALRNEALWTADAILAGLRPGAR